MDWILIRIVIFIVHLCSLIIYIIINVFLWMIGGYIDLSQYCESYEKNSHSNYTTSTIFLIFPQLCILFVSFPIR